MKESIPRPRTNTETPSEEILPSLDYYRLQVEYAFEAMRVTHKNFEDAVAYHTGIMQVMYDTSEDRESAEEGEKKADEFLENSKPYVESGDASSIARLIYKDSLLAAGMDSKKDHPYGCFSYQAIRDEDRGPNASIHGNEIRIHFVNVDNTKGGPLSPEKIERRRREICTMFKQIRKELSSDDFTVNGHSWLYNLPRYRELFPQEYQDSIVPDNPQDPNTRITVYRGLWFQFLKSDGSLNRPLADEFMRKAREANTEDELIDAFPYKVLRAHAPISAFYQMVDEYESEHPGVLT